jgi:hypothetical protein
MEAMASNVSKKSNPELWKRIVASVKAGSKGGDAGSWSGRKAQLATARYKKSGGGYKGAKSSSNSLSKWSKQKWTTASGKKSKDTGEAYFPSAAVAALKKAGKYSKATAQKRAATKSGKQNASYSADIQSIVKRYR